MSIPLDRLYQYIEDTAQSIFKDRVIIYRFYPHGSKNLLDLTTTRLIDFYLEVMHPHIYCHDQEPLAYDFYKNMVRYDSLFGKFKHFKYPSMRQQSVLLHSEKRSTNLEQYTQDNYVPSYWWSHAVIALDWFRYARHVVLHPCPQKTFLAYNRSWGGTREYRLKFLDYLIDHDLVNSCRTWFNPVDPGCQAHFQQHQFDNPKWKPIHNLEKYFHPTDADSNSSADFDLDDYNTFDIEVVLETLFDDGRLHLTEKILRPIALGKPFILAGTYGSLEYLRDYGFRTFDEIWPEQYDLETDSDSRLKQITSLMRDIENWDPKIRQERVAQAQIIADHNRKHFFSTEFFDQVVTELKTNLDTAIQQVSQSKDYQGFLNFWNDQTADPIKLQALIDETSILLPNIADINRIKKIMSAQTQDPDKICLSLDQRPLSMMDLDPGS